MSDVLEVAGVIREGPVQVLFAVFA